MTPAQDEKLRKSLGEILLREEAFLVELLVRPGKITILADKIKGINLTECIAINRSLRDELEDSGIFELNELEVSSPGADRPLKVLQQYQKYTGWEVHVETEFNGIVNGTLQAANTDGISVFKKPSPKISKKKINPEQTQYFIPFTEIKKTNVILSIKKF